MADKESGSGRPGFVQILREGWSSPQKRPETAELPTKTTEEETATKPTNGAQTPPAATTAAEAAGSAPPDPNLDERMEGLQGWMAEIERKQRRMTFFGGVGVALAVLAAGGALYLALTTPNTASKDDFDDLEAQVGTLQQQVTQATTDQTRLKALNASIESLVTRLAASEQKAAQQASEIAAVKAQAQAAQAAATAATPAPALTPTAPTTPGSKQQP